MLLKLLATHGTAPTLEDYPAARVRSEAERPCRTRFLGSHEAPQTCTSTDG